MGMVEVSKDEFFKCIGPKNVHPRSEPYYSAWELVGSREIIGRSELATCAETVKASE